MSATRLHQRFLVPLVLVATSAAAMLRVAQDPAPGPNPAPAPSPTPSGPPGEPAPVVVARKDDPPANGAPPAASKPATSAQGREDPPAASGQAPALVPERVTQSDALSAPLAWDGRAPASAEELATLLASFENAYRGGFRYRSLGRSRGGREVWLASVTRSATEDLSQVPSLLCAPRWDLPSGTAALEDALNQCAALLEAQARDTALAARLDASAVHWLLDPQPDRTFGAAGATAGASGGADTPTALDFPAGWAARGAPRPHPLFDPETRAVATFALAAPAIGAFARSGASSDDPFAPVTQLESSAGGSLERFVSEYLGARVYDLPGGTQARSESRVQSAQRVASLLAALPHLSADAPRVERLREDVWLFDVPLSNTGRIATLEGAAAARERASVWMQLASPTGATLAAVACAPSTGAAFEPLSCSAERVCLGHIAGGATATLRVVVRGSEGTRATLAIRSLRAGSLDVPLELK